MYSKINNVGCNICSADILWAGFRLAGSLIRRLFCHFFPHVLAKLQPFFLYNRSVSLLVFLLSTCQSFVSSTFKSVHVGTRALGLFEDCVCGLDCSDISCWFNVTLHLQTLSSGSFSSFFPSPLNWKSLWSAYATDNWSNIICWR